MTKKTISHKNLPTRLPVILTLVVWLTLDRVDPEGWVYGVVWAIVGLMWIASVINLYEEVWVDIFEEKE